MFSGLAAIGSTVWGLAAGSTAAFLAGVATSAVVGAAIGGISAAVMGGDIGKGMLFGAIGGIVTGGIAGGSLVGGTGAATAGGGGTGGIGMSQSAMVAGAGSTEIYGSAAATGLAEGGAATGLLSGTKELSMDIGSNMIGEKVVDFAIGGLMEDPEMRYGDTKEGFLAQLASNERRTNTTAAAAKGAQHNWGITEEGIRYAGDEAFGLKELSGEQQLAATEQEYKLRGDEASATYARENQKYALAANARGGSEFSGASDATKAAIIASQGGALQGVA